jgi:hypothetical protein
VQTGDTDVVNALDVGPERPRRQRRLAGHRAVAGAGRENRNAPARGRQRPHRDRLPVDENLVVRGLERLDRLGRRAGDEDRTAAAEPGDDVEDLTGGLAGAVDDLGVAGPQRAVGVDERVGELFVRGDREPVDGVGGRQLSRGHGVEEGAHGFAVHGRSVRPGAGYPPVVALDSGTLQVVALAAAAVAVLSLGLCLSLILRISRIRTAYDTLVAGEQGVSFVDAIHTQSAGIDALRNDVRVLREDLSAARADLSDALRHVAVVRYDAFGDMGGRMSFSAALLDDAGDGLVLTSINGRSETRTYAKGVKSGSSDHSLSPEEEQAIGYATRGVDGRDGDANLTGASRRARR